MDYETEQAIVGPGLGRAIDYELTEAQNAKLSQLNIAVQDLQTRGNTLKDRLIRQREQSQAETARLTELIGLLESNPAIQRVLELMGKG